jgi:type VI secretion system protein ImpM
MSGLAPTAGWFGKLPTLGDFAHRRLPASFLECWDPWLQQGMQVAARELGDRFLELFMTFPVWRFAIPHGCIGDAAWIGVLLPSVDRVGRAFPLTLAEPLAAGELGLRGLAWADQRLDRLAAIGVDALADQTPEQLETALESMPIRQPARAPADIERVLFTPDASGACTVDDFAIRIGQFAQHALVSRLGARALWWVPATPEHPGALLIAPMPLDGRLLTTLIAAEPDASATHATN